MKEDLEDDNQITENCEEVNSTRKQQNVYQRIVGTSNQLDCSHRDSRRNDNSDQQILPQTGNEANNLTTSPGLGVTVTVAGMSLFSLNRTHKKG